jgi:hypothetical protein
MRRVGSGVYGDAVGRWKGVKGLQRTHRPPGAHLTPPHLSVWRGVGLAGADTTGSGAAKRQERWSHVLQAAGAALVSAPFALPPSLLNPNPNHTAPSSRPRKPDAGGRDSKADRQVETPKPPSREEKPEEEKPQEEKPQEEKPQEEKPQEKPREEKPPTKAAARPVAISQVKDDEQMAMQLHRQLNARADVRPRRAPRSAAPTTVRPQGIDEQFSIGVLKIQKGFN